MKGRKSNKLFAVIAMVLIAALVAIPAGAVLKVKATDNYAKVAGTSMDFTKYLVIPKDSNVPELEFTYGIVGGAAVDGNEQNMPIYAGDDTTRVTKVDTDKDYLVKVGKATFTNGMATTNGTATDGIANDTTKKYAQTDVTIDFSNAQYSEPGVYRYIVTETLAAGTSTNQAVRTVDVNVINDPDNAGALKVQSYVMYYGNVTSYQNKTTVKEDTDTKKAEDETIDTGDKCDNYVNFWPVQSLYVGKKISGNQASKDKYFKFTVTLTNAGSKTRVVVDGNYNRSLIEEDVNGATTDIPEGGYQNPATFETGTDGTSTQVFFLQGDQYIRLMGLPEDTGYTVTEADYKADGYVSTATAPAADPDPAVTFDIVVDAQTTLTFNAATTGTIEDEDIFTGYKNEKDGSIPTGVILSVAPWVVAGIVILAGVVFFAIRSKRKYEEQ